MNFSIEGDTFRKIIDAVKEIVTETNIIVSDKGMEIQAMDNTHVALVKMSIEKDKFLGFKCNQNRELGVNLTNLSKILKTVNIEDRISIEQKDGVNDKMSICFENLTQTRHAQFEFTLLQLECEKFELPEMEHELKFSMSAKEFSKLCFDLKEIGDTLTVSSDTRQINFHVKGDVSEGSIKFTNDLGMEMSKPSSYALKYMCMFSRAFPLSENVDLFFSSQIPAMIQFETAAGTLSFFLAPKID